MDNKPGKRKSRMNNIKSRMNSGSYNMAKFKANEKDLREKIAFFEKKEAKGELKDYMYPRMEEAKSMYDELMALKSGAPLPTVAAAAAEPISQFDREEQELANNQRNAAIESLFPGTLSSVPAQTRKKATAVPKMTLKKLNKQRREAEATALAASYAPPEFNPPPSPAALPAPYGHYNNSGLFHINGTVAPTAYNLGQNAAGAGGYGTAFNNIATYRNAVPAVTAPPNKPTTTRRQRTPVPIYNEYYEQAVPQFLPLPEFYDPYTGRKFAPEEDPLTPIESAYHELKDILKRAHLKAASLRKKAARATKRRTKAKKNNKISFNAGLRIRLPPKNVFTPNNFPGTGQVLQPQENLHI
jgi:hypothetical protein